MYRYFIVLVLSYCSIQLSCTAKRTLNPIQYGLLEAKTPYERYDILYKTHCEARRLNANVSYKGIKSINLSIPEEALSIPLADNTDFSGTNIYVTNNSKDFYLFELTNELAPIDVSKEQVDNGDFTNIPALSKGYFLLVLEDETPWVKERVGYNYPVIRKDVLLIRNGKSLNKVISSYNNEWSKVKASYRSVSKRRKTILNLRFIRTTGSSKKTFFAQISNQNNVAFSNIEICTPKDTLIRDVAIAIRNCTNIRLDRISINGTYSLKDWSGYGISLGNVWNISFNRFVGFGNWGVFGGNNVNYVTFKNSEMNRFDIHCYGKDVFFKDCSFRDLNNQFSSIFGILSFERCDFKDFVPVYIEPSFNAYTKFELRVNNCTVRDYDNKNYFIKMEDFYNSPDNERPELKEKYWPDIYINGLKIETGEKPFRLSNFNKEMLNEDDVIKTIINLKNIRLN